MATQTSTSTNKGNPNKGQKAARETGRSAAAPAATTSGTPETDETYAIVSVLYHALQGAETYGKYVNDARASNDEELVEFLEECRDELNGQAVRARQLLAGRLDESMEDEDADDDEDEEGED